MAKSRSRKKSAATTSSSLLRKLFYYLAALITGSGAGSLAFPDIPVIGPAVNSAVQQLRQLSTESSLPSISTPQSTISHATTSGVAPYPATVHTVSATTQNPAPPRQPASNTIAIGSFNIQVFGTSKINKHPTIDIIATVVRSFDVLAIQEIRTQDDHFLDQFMQLVNSTGSQYAYLIGPRLGRTSSKEQYAFLYNTARIEVSPTSVTTLLDPNDLLHREPFVALFRARDAPPAQAFTFWLVNIHTDPDEVASEVSVLADAFQVVQQQGDDDVILLGDLNASENQLGPLGKLPGIRCAITGIPTNTRGNKTYDNMIFDSRKTTEFTGQSGVWNLMASFGLTQEQALEISDHFPIGAIFSIYEGGQPSVAAMPNPPR
jgi:endonuclease/exonuclease/phosphatase family metal-dependent hydrolase